MTLKIQYGGRVRFLNQICLKLIRKLVLDTNLYLGAIRNRDKEAALDAFLERRAPVTFMSAVVLQELRAGAVTDAAAYALDRGIFDVFERRGRVLGPRRAPQNPPPVDGSNSPT